MSTPINPSNNSGQFVPLYIRIQERIRTAITEGRLSAGDRIWSETELGREYATTRSTVRRALDKLVFEGLVVRYPGRGSFVAESNVVHSPIDSSVPLPFEEQVAQTGRLVTYRSPSLTLSTAPQRYAERLGVGVDTLVFKLERLRLIDDQPVSLEVRYIPRAIGAKVTGEMLANHPAHTFVGEIIGQPIPAISVSVTAENATPYIADLLNLPEGTALIVRDNSHYSSDGSIVLCGRSFFAGNISTDYVLGQMPKT